MLWAVFTQLMAQGEAKGQAHNTNDKKTYKEGFVRIWGRFYDHSFMWCLVA